MTEMEGEVANQDFYLPGLLPKVPGRFYYLFGKPIRTEGREKMLKDRENAKEVYMEIKSEVENSMAYTWKRCTRWFQFATSPVMFSTLEDGRIVRGLSGVPDDGPVLLVGYHNLLGLELAPLILEFLREKNVMVRGIAHPGLFTPSSTSNEFSYFDMMKVFGALPVTPSNLFKLFSSKSFSLLYPGGARDALHRKGEEYKLFWPEQPEFVRMAAKFGATIVPFGAVGEDDLAELVLDYDDVMKIPVLNDYIRKQNKEGIRLRTEMEGEVANRIFTYRAFCQRYRADSIIYLGSL